MTWIIGLMSFLSSAVVAALVSAAVTIATLIVQGNRSERERKREVYANAFAAYTAYREFPYAIERRESESPAERRRISGQLARVQERIGFHEAWIECESKEVGQAYQALLTQARETAGERMHKAWRRPGISSDAEMNLPPLDLARLKPLEQAFLEAVSRHLK